MTSSSKSAASEAKESAEKRLEAGLEESFPASDPPAVIRSNKTASATEQKAHDEACERKIAESDALDEALAETFPASDPPAMITPHSADDEDPADCEKA